MNILKRLLVLAMLPAYSSSIIAATHRVGAQQTIKLPSKAALQAKDGDIIEIEAGDYNRDAAIWRADNLTLRGVNGMARLHSEGVTVNGKGIWLIKGNNTVVENIGFYEARVNDRNGAGIRLEGTNLTVKHCLFRDNENGILTDANANSEVLVENSEFDHNGHGDGKSHNLYIGAIKRFTLKDSYSHHAYVGHQVKSRAAESLIIGNTLEDGSTGQSSYLIDLPAGGADTIKENTLGQGPKAENPTMISYGAEKQLHPLNKLIIDNNVFINRRSGNCILVDIKASLQQPAQVRNNHFTGCNRFNGQFQSYKNTFAN